jgi:hypothetical protein
MAPWVIPAEAVLSASASLGESKGQDSLRMSHLPLRVSGFARQVNIGRESNLMCLLFSLVSPVLSCVSCPLLCLLSSLMSPVLSLSLSLYGSTSVERSLGARRLLALGLNGLAPTSLLVLALLRDDVFDLVIRIVPVI